MDSLFLQKKDYEEPRCPLSKPTDVRRVPIGRIMEKLDEYLGRNDLPAAERHLNYWLLEAETEHDERGELSILNEQIGLYRKMGKEAEGLKTIEQTLNLLNKLNMENTITAGTTFLNAATGYKAFDRTNEALQLYKKAREIYENNLQKDDTRLGGLYNNMAITLTELGSFEEAETLYKEALEIMAKASNGEGEMAVTYCNLADLAAAQFGTIDGEKAISEYLQKAEELLNTESLPKDGNYAFICEKCAPTFGYYGYFLTEQSLRKRSKEIYERN